MHLPKPTDPVAKPDTYEVYAIRYATRAAQRADHFIGGDPHDAPMPMDYYVWVARSAARTFVIDTGFTREVGERRKRTFLRCPVESLALIGIDPAGVCDVIQTHLHYDHVGNFAKFPAARFHLQERELAYATGRYVRHDKIRHSFEVDDIVGMVRLNHAGRVELYDGAEELAPGLWIHPAPGHSAGLQMVRCWTRRGWVVVASDVAHYYEMIESGRPFTTLLHLGDMLENYRRLKLMAERGDHVVPGHDPEVMRRHAPAGPELEGIVARLD
jgi:glyoxylase-like metal-dependent hydrolase (beta-lactamase superfamily II)